MTFLLFFSFTSVSMYEQRPVPSRFTIGQNVSGEALAIAGICMLDLLTTLYWVSQGQAREGNPLMAFFLGLGHIPFIGAKVATFVPALIAAEWYRQRKPAFVRRMLRWVIALYLFIYVVGVAGHYGQVLDYYGALLFGA